MDCLVILLTSLHLTQSHSKSEWNNVADILCSVGIFRTQRQHYARCRQTTATVTWYVCVSVCLLMLMLWRSYHSPHLISSHLISCEPKWTRLNSGPCPVQFGSDEVRWDETRWVRYLNALRRYLSRGRQSAAWWRTFGCAGVSSWDEVESVRPFHRGDPLTGSFHRYRRHQYSHLYDANTPGDNFMIRLNLSFK